MDPTSAPSNRPEFLSTAATSSSSSSSPPKQWRKVLWTSSGFPDNHVDSSFLEEMRRNISTPIYSWRRVFFDAEVVSRQLSCVSIFLAVFAFLFLEWASPKLVLGVAGVVSAVGFGVYRICVGGEDSSRDCASSSSSSATCSCDPVTPATPFTSPATSSATPLTHSACSATSYTSFTSSSTPSSSSIPSPTSSASPSLLSILQCFPYLALCYGLSPILITLTRTISEDTIYAMTALMLFAYLLFYDYRPSASMTSSPISLNAAIFASVCLASRLPSVLHTFAIVSLALTTFALWPALHRRLGVLLPPPILHVATLSLIGVSTVAVSYVSVVGSWLLVGSHLVILGFCPLFFVSLQKDKHNIYGPWDEAVIKD